MSGLGMGACTLSTLYEGLLGAPDAPDTGAGAFYEVLQHMLSHLPPYLLMGAGAAKCPT